MPRPPPDAVQQSARRRLDEPPKFSRKEGAEVGAEQVPRDIRGQLEGARRAFLSRIANTPDSSV